MKSEKNKIVDFKDSSKVSDQDAEEAFKKILKWIGEDPSREGLIETPKRVAKAFKEYFKGYNDIPMSTTWVFVGLLAGRELAFATVTQKYKFKTVFPLVGKDFFKMMIGLALSVVIVLMIHGFTGFANM